MNVSPELLLLARKRTKGRGPCQGRLRGQPEAHPEYQCVHQAVDTCSLELRPATVLHQLSIRTLRITGSQISKSEGH